MKSTYTFTLLRYVHDIATGEFVNVGVALYAPEAGYISALCNPRYGRLSKFFIEVDGEHLRSLMRFIQARFEEYGGRLRAELPLEGKPPSIMEIATAILPRDDSSLQWSEPGGGLTEDPASTLENLYTRLVEKYEQRPPTPSRTDDEVWRAYRKELETRQLLVRLRPKRIVAKDYEYEFEHAWKNGAWHVYQPLSMDLADAESILDKANRWLGRATTLRDSADPFHLWFLVGDARLDNLKPAYAKALNILARIPGPKQVVTEADAAQFSAQLAGEMAEHH